MKTLSIILLVATLAGCHQIGEQQKDAYVPTLYRDPVTGCEYISTASSHTLTPRIDSDGLTHRGCRKQERTSP